MTAVNPWRRKAEIDTTQEGAEYSYSAFPDWKIQVRPTTAWSPAFGRALRVVALQEQFADYYERRASGQYVPEDGDADIETAIFTAAFGEGLIVSWSVNSPDGEDYPPTRENIAELLSAFPDLANELKAFASDATNYPLSEDVREALALKN